LTSELLPEPLTPVTQISRPRGAMLGDALELIYVAPWTVMLPGAALMISVLIVNLLGDGIRRAVAAGVE